jgi:glutamyl-tRNA synthetase
VLGLGKVAQPLRVAVCGSAISPAIDITLSLLGKEKTLARIQRAISHIINLN